MLFHCLRAASTLLSQQKDQIMGIIKHVTIETIALRKIRELKGLSRKEAGALLSVSCKQIEKIENGRSNLSEPKILNYLSQYNISKNDFLLICEGKFDIVKNKYGPPKPKIIENNKLRRSYKRIITKEVRVLINLRKIKKYSQFRASLICGYARCTMGHIENGRIEIPKDRIKHIVNSYGFTIEAFDKMMKSEVLRDEILDKCISTLETLADDKLHLLQSLLANLKI